MSTLHVRPGRVRARAALAALAAIAAIVAADPAAAQQNSLFRRGSPPAPAAPPAPTTQPATAIEESILAGRERVLREEPEPRANAVLLTTSPIAVRLPEPETIKVNDLVTVIVRVSKSAKSDATLESNKEWTHEWSLDDWIRLSDEHGIVPAEFPAGKPAVGFDYEDDYSTDGKYDRRDELTTRIQARVIDVKPNGNLVLEATSDIAFGEEEYTITLTGTCRSRDLTPQNTILSSQIADLTVHVEDRGAVRDAARRGWLKRGLDFLRPF